MEIRRIFKTKIYTLCNEQTFLIFISPKCAVLNLQGCKEKKTIQFFVLSLVLLQSGAVQNIHLQK
jgi:hypothetical protein